MEISLEHVGAGACCFLSIAANLRTLRGKQKTCQIASLRSATGSSENAILGISVLQPGLVQLPLMSRLFGERNKTPNE